MPETIEAVLAARIDRLPPEEKRLLQTAAVIGMDVTVPLLQAVTDLAAAELHTHLGHLQTAEFLYETGTLPASAYTFKHALTQEVAYESLLQERRRGLHRRIVEILERLYPDRLAEQVERLAPCPAGRSVEQGPDVLSAGGEKAVAQSAYREAEVYFEQALSTFPHLPETRDMREQAIDLRFALHSALMPLGNSERILTYLREAESLAGPRDPRRLRQVSLFLPVCFYRMGAYDQAIAAAQRALALATASGEVGLYAQANYYLGTASQAQGDYRQAIDCFRADRGIPRGDATPRALWPPQPAHRALPCLARRMLCRARHVR